MCGIAGILDTRGRGVDGAVLSGMLRKLVHRGPDAEGVHIDGPMVLGHRRLSIIDHSTGQQPMAIHNGTIWISFNGEIYNFLQLRKELESKGRQFQTHSDTEVILHAYAQYGDDFLSHLRGMFAFALWDGRNRRLVLARDRIGKKPLFYAFAAGEFVFASELQALMVHPHVSREVDPKAIDDYLTYGYIPAPGTIFSGVQKLEPGHFLVLEGRAGGFVSRKHRYWRLAYEPKRTVTPDEAQAGLLSVLTEAVRLRLIADVPVGALLSGGIDSSVVVALMSRLSTGKVKTFSIGFEEHDFNELPYARAVAQRYSTDHHELIVCPSLLDVLPTLVTHYGEPYADSSAIPTYYVAKLTRQHVTVALNGDGGDESLAGYERYLGSVIADQYRRIPRLVRAGLIEPAARMIPNGLPRFSRLRKAKRFLAAAALPSGQRYLRWMTYFTTERKAQIYSREFNERLRGCHGEDWLNDLLNSLNHGTHHAVDTLLAADTVSYLPFDLLVKMDIASMANSLETRSPFLDHKVMEFCAQLPVEFKIRGRTLKYLLRKVAAELLPAQNIQRRKMGFGVPVGQWMKNNQGRFLEDTLFSTEALKRSYFKPNAVRSMVADHVNGREDYSQQLWSLLWLEHWHHAFLT